MTKVRWWIALVLASIAIVALDIATGPYVLFPILFVVPVGLGAWHLGRGAGIGLAVALVGCRFWIAVVLEAGVTPTWAAAMNATIRLVVLVGLAALFAKVAQQQRALAERVHVLEGFLPICGFCKKIRRDDGQWEQIESYISQRTAAQFTHGFCETCGREHYAELYAARESGAVGPGAAPDRDTG